MTPTFEPTSPAASSPATIPPGFARRHIGPSDADIQEMLRTVGAASMEELIHQTLPDAIRQSLPLDLGPALSETEALAHLRQLASRNQVMTSLIGMGYHGTLTPAVIQRNVLENPAWYTAYTPYQPEISQGRLEALLNFQTMIADLTALDIANASLLDEATAAAEGMALAHRSAKSTSTRVFADRNLHPQTIGVLHTRATPLGWTVVVGDPEECPTSDVFCGIFQYPGTYGEIRDFRAVIDRLHAAQALAVLACDPLALTLLTPPGELGADVAIGSTQRFGVPMGFGGPHAAYMAVKDELKRAMPGRLVGVSVDAHGRPAFRLSLQTREQHIRREKATSNICTAQVLLAVIASFYAVYHGPEGLTAIARDVRRKTSILAAGLAQLGFTPRNSSYFDTLTIPVGAKQADILARAQAEKLNLRVIPAGHPADDAFGITLDETTTPEVIEAVWRAFGGDLHYADITAPEPPLPVSLTRTSAFLTHPIFHLYRSETELLRYIRKLSDRDLALDRAMIPLGSCTMKLNATTEMLPISWPEWNAIHPFAPPDQTAGYRALLDDLERQLCAITGYDAISFQPNSGAQGEYAGLLAIRAYHHSRGDTHRTVCLIPSSAHGTNPASAHMAGMEVEVVACDEHGNVDLADLTAKAEKHSAQLAAVMITYPSTHGVFEENIREICSVVHQHGGQVYIDGANLNAQVGLSRPGDYGADVSHLNLHKTFCIPHGGGGPGMGPIGVREHLRPFLPGHFTTHPCTHPAGPVSAAAYGSASILVISYLYILMMAGDGLRAATEVAILSANYIAARLAQAFPLLYKNLRGRVAHECIVDPRPFKDSAGVTVDDIAKRLIDYGFHAPTVSFPVPGTLMIEPTESESKAELDRFCDAMIAIRAEIDEIVAGKYPVADSPLRHAPHTAFDVTAETWTRPYSRAQGCFPSGHPKDKYWPEVSRIDQVAGDRNLVCACPPIDSYR